MTQGTTLLPKGWGVISYPNVEFSTLFLWVRSLSYICNSYQTQNKKKKRMQCDNHKTKGDNMMKGKL